MWNCNICMLQSEKKKGCNSRLGFFSLECFSEWLSQCACSGVWGGICTVSDVFVAPALFQSNTHFKLPGVYRWTLQKAMKWQGEWTCEENKVKYKERLMEYNYLPAAGVGKRNSRGVNEVSMGIRAFLSHPCSHRSKQSFKADTTQKYLNISSICYYFFQAVVESFIQIMVQSSPLIGLKTFPWTADAHGPSLRMKANTWRWTSTVTSRFQIAMEAARAVMWR